MCYIDFHAQFIKRALIGSVIDLSGSQNPELILKAERNNF